MKILVVEDEKEIADGIKLILEKSGYQTDVVYDGSTGLDYILSGIYDLILLDIMLPVMSGIEVLKTVRNKGVRIPVILLTAKSQSEDKVLGLDTGADDYLTKPFDAAELLARIRARLRSKDNPLQNGRINVYDIELEPGSYRLIKGEKSVKLSKKEYHLMEYLGINKGQILTKDMILNKVWGYDDNTEYNSLEVYVSFIRKKLRFVNAKACIVTKKGIGYSMEEGCHD